MNPNYNDEVKDEQHKYIYFAGDLFLSQADSVNLESIISDIFGNGTVIFNLEGVPCSSTGFSNRKAVPLTLNPEALKLANSPNCFFSVVNNHASDCGTESFKNCLCTLGEKALFSSTRELDPRKKIGNSNFIFLADEREECLCDDYDFLRFDKSVIIKIREFIKGAFVIIHGGIENRVYPTPYQRYLSHLIIEFGAIAVIFHHSHVTGSFEWISGKLVHYGLGNFYFSEVNGLHGTHKNDGVVLRYCLTNNNFEIAPVCYNNLLGKINLNLEFKQLSDKLLFPEFRTYKAWYKSKYPLDSSLRPRQLYHTESIIRAQYMLWYLVASRMSRYGLTSFVKKILRSVLFSKDKIRFFAASCFILNNLCLKGVIN